MTSYTKLIYNDINETNVRHIKHKGKFEALLIASSDRIAVTISLSNMVGDKLRKHLPEEHKGLKWEVLSPAH